LESFALRTKGTRTRSVGQATEARILEAAEEVFARFGFEGARMEQVAERAGVEKANIYYYFKGKEQLYRALMDRILNQLLTEVSNFLAEPAEGAPFERLDGFLDIFFNIVQRYQGAVALAFGEMLHPPRKKQTRSPVAKMLEQIETIGTQLIADGVASGDFPPQDPAHTLITLEGILFHYFFLPEDRLANLMGGKKFDGNNLERRKEAIRSHIKKVLLGA
jgi:TetR/AcrR family transcriptional regulator